MGKLRERVFHLYPLLYSTRDVMEEFIAWADIIGTIAGVLVLSSFIPQLRKAYKTKKMSDVSIHLMILIASGMFLWVIYGLIRNDPVIIGTNASGFILNIILIALKLKYDKIQRTVFTG
jgi:MtN3 and saliva related transmembrane protein